MDKELYAAQTQRHITFLLVYVLMFLVVGLMICSFLPMQVNDKILALANPLVTGIFGLASGAVGFWIARNRQGTDPSSTPLPQPPEQLK